MSIQEKEVMKEKIIEFLDSVWYDYTVFFLVLLNLCLMCWSMFYMIR